MKSDKNRVSRRDFLQALAAAAALPLLTARGTAAADVTTQTVTAASAAATTGTTAGAAISGDLHRVITANILLASSAHDGTPAAWSNRRDLVLRVLRSHNPDLLCMQEVLRSQAEDFARAFSEYEQFGFSGPFMDKNPDGYHGVTKNVIMFRRDRYEMTSAGNFWLSETPLIAGSVSWDALRGRHVNWVRLRDKKSRREFRLIDTHFDHKGQTARENQARMVNEESAQYAESFPQILCGDLNAEMANPAVQALLSTGWKDAYTTVHGAEESGLTFHGLKGKDYHPKNPRGRIDYILTRGLIDAKAAQVLKDHDGDKYPSDHFFLMSDVVIG